MGDFKVFSLKMCVFDYFADRLLTSDLSHQCSGSERENLHSIGGKEDSSTLIRPMSCLQETHFLSVLMEMKIIRRSWVIINTLLKQNT